jgi:ribosomal protein S18 acetylase RimI-like enzyme
MEITGFNRNEVAKNLDLLIKEISDFRFESWNSENFLRELPRKWDLSLVVKEGQKILGFSFNSCKDDVLYIHFFYVFKDSRSKNIGKILLKDCTRLAKKNKFHGISLKCNIDNFGAIGFYLRNGFKIAGRETNFFLMSKALV